MTPTTRSAVAQLHSTGLFKLLRPAAHGGREADLGDFFRAVREISAEDAALGWMGSMLAFTQWYAALFDDRVCAEVWADSPDALIGPAFAPRGTLRRGDGGYLLNGQWRWTPAADECAWFLLGTVLYDDEVPVDYVVVMVPKSDVELGEHWDLAGLRGAGARAVSVSDALIPAHRTYGSSDRDLASLHAVEKPLIYRVPFTTVHAIAAVAPILGAVQGAYQEMEFTPHNLAEPAALARAMVPVDAAVALLDKDLEDQLAEGRDGDVTSISLRVRLRRDHAYAVESAQHAISVLVRLSAAGALREGSAVRRAWEDIAAASAYVVNHPEDGFVLYGRWAYGFGVDDSLILL